jgi:hypothetical protein
MFGAAASLSSLVAADWTGNLALDNRLLSFDFRLPKAGI